MGRRPKVQGRQIHPGEDLAVRDCCSAGMIAPPFGRFLIVASSCVRRRAVICGLRLHVWVFCIYQVEVLRAFLYFQFLSFDLCFRVFFVGFCDDCHFFSRPIGNCFILFLELTFYEDT